MDTHDWLRLSMAFGAGNPNITEFIDLDEPDESIRRMLSEPDLQSNKYIRRFKALSNSQLDNVTSFCEDNNVNIVTLDSEQYPKGMLSLDAPPLVLFVVGDISVLQKKVSAAVVGARLCSEYSLKVASLFTRALSENGVNIVSGHAVGIDSAAHATAIDAGGTTAAFLGCGLFCDYPKGSIELRKQIAEHGAVISEFLPRSLPIKDNFKIRNRLIAAVSHCTLVIEAKKKSGSLNTAYHANDLGKDVFVIPPADLFDERYSGQKLLLEQGAELALSPEALFLSLKDADLFVNYC